MTDRVSLPTLTNGKFTGRALNHITTITQQATNTLKTETTEALTKKADQATLDNFIGTLTSTLTDSEAKTALASTQAAVSAERASREEADSALADRVSALEGAEVDLSGYATKEELGQAIETRQDKLIIYQGSVDLGELENGRMVGVLAETAGSIEGYDVTPGQVWVFVSNGSSWTGYLAGGGGGASGTAAGSRPTLTTTQVTDKSARISWPPVDGAASYEGRVSGGMIQAVTSPWDITGLAMATSYTIEVRSVSQTGKKSAWATVNFKTGEAPAEPLALQTSATDGTITITTTTAANDSTLATAAPYGKTVSTVKSLPGAGYVEFTVKPASQAYQVSLNGGGWNTGASTIGVSIQPSGVIMMSGGSYAGGVDSKSTVAAGDRLRLGRTTEALYIEQKQGSSWVRLGAQAVSGSLASTKLGIFGGGQPTAWGVTSVAGAGWV